MAEVGTYLTFRRDTEAAFLFYREVFGVEFEGAGVMRMGDNPPPKGAPGMSEEDKQLVMNVGIRITGGHLLMGTDAPESFGFNLNASVVPGRSAQDRPFVDSGRSRGSACSLSFDRKWTYFRFDLLPDGSLPHLRFTKIVRRVSRRGLSARGQ